jgi:N-ethylmaleimide reductase
MTTKRLLSPTKVGAVTVRNRVVMAPMTRRRSLPGNVPGPLAAEYYAQRASAGLVISEAALVCADGASYPGSPGIYDDAQLEAWRGVARAVHDRGAPIFLQLWHAGRLSDPAFLNGALPVAPSAIAIRGHVNVKVGDDKHPFVAPRALDASELPGIVSLFARAAERARTAGFDGVEVHAAQGYLIDQFLRDGANARTDAYGGSVANRARLLLEIIDALAATWSADRVGVQLSPTSTLGDMSDSDPAATFGFAAAELGRRGLAYLAVFEPLAGGPRHSPAMRRAFGGAFIVNGGYDATTAEAALAMGDADLVAFGRPFIANPDLPERIAKGAPWSAPDPSTFYGGGAKGYTDYPTS